QLHYSQTLYRGVEAVARKKKREFTFFSNLLAKTGSVARIGGEAGMRLLLTGASGSLGSNVLRECLRRGEAVIAWSGRREGKLFGCPLHPIDLAEPDAISSAFREARPDVVIHTAALAVVSDCYRDPQRAERINTHGSAILAELADRAKIPLLHVSTDMV